MFTFQHFFLLNFHCLTYSAMCALFNWLCFCIKSNQCSDRYFYEKYSEKKKRHVMALTSMSPWCVSTVGAKMHLTAFFQDFDNFEELKSIIVKHTLTVGKWSWIGMWAKKRLLDWFDSKGSWGWGVLNSVIQTLSHGRAHRHCHHTCKTDIGHKQPSPLVPLDCGKVLVGGNGRQVPHSLACGSGLGTPTRAVEVL